MNSAETLRSDPVKTVTTQACLAQGNKVDGRHDLAVQGRGPLVAVRWVRSCSSDGYTFHEKVRGAIAGYFQLRILGSDTLGPWSLV